MLLILVESGLRARKKAARDGRIHHLYSYVIGSVATPCPQFFDRSPFDRSGQQATQEISLHGEEDRQRYRHRNESPRRQEIPSAAVGSHHSDNGTCDDVAATSGVDQKHYGPQEIVKRPQKLDDRVRGEHRNAERQNDPDKNLEIIRAVELGVFDNFARYADHVAVQKKDGERQCGRGLGEPYAQKTLADTDVHMQLQNGDQGNLGRHDKARDDRRDQQCIASEIHPGERVGGKCGHHDWDNRRRNCHGQRVEKGLPQTTWVPLIEQHPVVIFECKFGWRSCRDEYALSATAQLIVVAAPDIVAVGLNSDAFSVSQVGHVAGNIDITRSRLGAPEDNLLRGPLAEQIARDRKDVAVSPAKVVRIGGPENFVLLGCKERCPPS